MLLNVQKRYLCLLLTAAMLLSGMCFENDKTDSYFSCSWHETERTVTVVAIFSAFSRTSARFCTNEMLGQGKIYGTAEHMRTLNNRLPARAPEILYEDDLCTRLKYFSWCLKMVRDVEYQDSGGGREIICYIQNKDGKKTDSAI